MRPGEVLRPGEQLVSGNGMYRAVLEADGGVAVHGPRRSLWTAGTDGAGVVELALQPDGNLVAYAAALAPVWHTGTWGRVPSMLVMQDDGNLVLYGEQGVLWATHTPGSRLGAGEALTAGERLVSPDARFRLELAPSGELVMVGPGRILWTSATAGSPGAYLVLQEDGNLVLYNASTTRALWHTSTWGTGTTQLVLQSDANLVLYSPTAATWAVPQRDTLLPGEYLTAHESLLSADGRFRLTLQGDGNLVAYGPRGAYWATMTSATWAVLQGDGNLVAYRADQPTWNSGSRGAGGNRLVVQSDGNIVLYSPTRAVWVAYYVTPRDAALDAAVHQAVQYANARGERAAVAVLDRATGYLYAAGDYTSPYASASIVKVAIAGQLLVTGQMPAVEASAWDMIVRSHDGAASALYGRVGGDGLINLFADRYGLGAHFGPPPVRGWWGLTRITAEGIVRLYSAMADDQAVAPWLLPAMGATQCAGADGYPQCFGIPAATGGWRIKQGWMANGPSDGAGYIHSTGFVEGDRYTVAILTSGPPSIYGGYGNETASLMAQILMPGGRMA